MKSGSTDEIPPPLPREWLPEPLAPDDAADWNAAVSAIMEAAEPKLRALATLPGPEDVSWWSLLGRWWTPAAGLAAAAAAILVIAQQGKQVGPAPGSLPLNVMAAEGDPAALWEGYGVEADPVLALIALQPRQP
jgi:hypothetical protein